MEKQTKKLVHFRPLFYSFLILTLAISCAKFIFDGKAEYIALVSVVFVCLFIFCIFQKKIIYFLVLLAVFGVGVGFYFIGMSTFTGKTYSQECQITGRISDDISYSEYENSFRVVLKGVKVNNKKSKNVSLKVNFQDVDDIRIGDVITFSAKLDNVKPFELGEFQSFYYRDNVAYSAEVSTDNISILKNKMTVDEKIRQKALSKLSDLKYGSVAYAVLFGDKSGISDEYYETFKSAGVIHMLTVSGLHISFLIGLLGWILKKCKVKGWLNLLVCALFVVFYAFLCGFSPSVTRACIMGLVLVFASAFGKRYDSLSTVGLAGIIILVVRPLFALDLGFLMSFFCVMSIFLLHPVVQKLFKKVMPSKIAGVLALTLVAQIGALPFVLRISETTNLLSVFANFIIVPIFSVIYPLLFISILIVLLLPFMSFLLRASNFGFGIIYKLADFFGQTKMVASFAAPNIFTIAICFILALCISGFFMASRKTKILTCCLLVCLSSISVVLADIVNKPQAGICVCYEYSNSVVLLTNKRGESVIIDIGGQAFTKKLLRCEKVESISTAFVLQSSRVKIDSLRDVGCQNIIRTGAGEGYAEEKLVALDETGEIGGFQFKYQSDKGKMIGLEIMFDDLRIFVCRDRYTAIENFETIGKETFDFVLVGKNSEYASAFEKTDKIAGFYEENVVFSSFERNGNMKFLLKNNNLVGRCLD